MLQRLRKRIELFQLFLRLGKYFSTTLNKVGAATSYLYYFVNCAMNSAEKECLLYISGI